MRPIFRPLRPLPVPFQLTFSVKKLLSIRSTNKMMTTLAASLRAKIVFSPGLLDPMLPFQLLEILLALRQLFFRLDHLIPLMI